MRYALLLGYLGEGFHGVVRQPGLRTVEGELLRVLMDRGYVGSEKEAHTEFSSRTDKGVSALMNVLALNMRMPPVLGEINAELNGIWIYGWTKVHSRFSPARATVWRWYRYVFPEWFTGDALERMREAARLFIGEHDFSSFCIPEGRRTRRTVRSIDVFNIQLTVMDIVAPSFLRQMVRRIAYALYMVGRGEWDVEDVKRRLEAKNPVPPMPPEGLVLMRIHIPSLVFQRENEWWERMRSAWEERRKAYLIRSVALSSYRWL